MLYSQYSHRVASKLIANNCMILKNPTKVCREKCPLTRGEKNTCDWISCSYCALFSSWLSQNSISGRPRTQFSKRTLILDFQRPTTGFSMHETLGVSLLACLFGGIKENPKRRCRLHFQPRNCKQTCEISSLLRVKLSHQHRYDETFPVTRMHEPRCQRNRQAA